MKYLLTIFLFMSVNDFADPYKRTDSENWEAYEKTIIGNPKKDNIVLCLRANAKVAIGCANYLLEIGTWKIHTANDTSSSTAIYLVKK